ncbi:Uma2 family endonuclease [Dyadobacter sp. CY356]|uniref:Uma2 family endonuclease n=1 Tax=Dyadobacter sp. CY356 TaxID=2906442 RepID=UPI001F3CB182|nr:Uma2 family endonuclease [Dyadobacter sp. CY356]MCF0056613.1 Uma2 family endonuclease [Dyadobacter sp. CY356]
MAVPLNLPGIQSFSDIELLELSLANPDLIIERDNNGQLFIKIISVPVLTSANKSELIGEVGIWNRKAHSGKILGPGCGYFLKDTSMRVPDVAWIRLERWNALSMSGKKSFPYLVPDFIIELKSETDSLMELKAKMQKWIDNGVRLGWLISTEKQITYVYKPDEELKTILFDELIFGEEVLDGFSIRLRDILEY